MIKVVAKHFVKENEIEDFLDIAEELVVLTVKEEGCIKYEMYQDEKDKSILTMIEEWESKEDLDKHMASEHFQRLVPIMSKYMEKSGEINVYKKVI